MWHVDKSVRLRCHTHNILTIRWKSPISGTIKTTKTRALKPRLSLILMGIRFLSSKLWAGAVICHCIFVQIWRDKVENNNRQKCIEQRSFLKWIWVFLNSSSEDIVIIGNIFYQRHLVRYFWKKILRRHFHSVFYPLCICIPISTFEHHLLQWLLNSCNSSTSTVQLVSNETRYGSSLFFLEKLQLLGSRAWYYYPYE